MSVGRKLLTAAGVIVLPALLTVVITTPASAKVIFPGPAVGQVSCPGPFGYKQNFHPRLRTSSGGTTFVVKNLTLQGCVVSNLPPGVDETVYSGKVSGMATGEPDTGCNGYFSGGGNDIAISLQIKWKGTYNGSKAIFSPSNATFNGFVPSMSEVGTVGFEIPNPNTQPSGGVVTGSFAGAITNESYLYTPWTPERLSSECSSANGVKRVEVAGGSLNIP
jgi:hypothetical protein